MEDEIDVKTIRFRSVFAFVLSTVMCGVAWAQAPVLDRNAPPGTPANPFQNLQVLKGMDRPQLLGEMQKMALALGVACTFCHVDHDGPSDDKQHKLIAREMIRMVTAINQQAALQNVSRTVECWTCHRGSAGIPNSPAPVAAPPAAGPPPAGSARQ